MELLEDIRAVEKRFPGKHSNSKLAELLTTKKPFKDKYKKLATDFPGFRKVIGRALNPKLNPAVSVPEGVDWITFRAQKAAQEFGLPTEIGIAAQLAMLERLVMERERQSFFEKHKDDDRDFVEAEWQGRLPAAREFAKLEAQRIRET